MEKRGPKRSLASPIIRCAILIWTILCFLGTIYFILRYGILLQGLVATVVTLLFATIIWIFPFLGLALVYFYFTPTDRAPAVMFQDLLREGIRRSELA